ncbi:expressed unknown protein [Seminavis robusta]|uniref:Uncharacterized protein n=1 Tax=Seminavis robusta TaxID=568900 RepID=A0A9N8DJ13_9STRA|nr:expressed unknown protein [Seminavis robusta]|eukprot:Sro184_g080090.1 n/a (557) ;mRNA; r:81555-83225
MVSTTVQEVLQCRRRGSTTLQLLLDHMHTSPGTGGTDDGLPRALAGITKVRRVEIPLQPFYITEPQWDYVQIADIFRALGELELLDSITIKARTLEGNPFPIGLLTCLLKPRRHRLRYLHLDVQRIQCLSRATRRLALALQTCTCLEWVKLKYCKLLTNSNNDNNDNNTALADLLDGHQQEVVDFTAMDPILSSLGKITTLKHLQLVGTSEGEDNEFAFDDDENEVFPTIGPGALVELLSSSSLQELRLEWIDLDGATIGSLSTALRSTSRLQKLVLGLFPEDKSSFKAFAGMLQHNQTLEVVHIHTAWRSAELSPLFGSSIVTTAAKNPTDVSMEKFLVLVGQALRRNTRLSEFHLCGPTMEDCWSSNAEEALVAALKSSNVVLKSLKIGNEDSDEGEIGGPIEYYLKLNKLNRKHFVHRYEQVTAEEWISVLANAGSDLNSVFYFLRLNPLLCMGRANSSSNNNNGRGHYLSTTTQPRVATSGRILTLPSSASIVPGSNERTSALTQAVANMIENVASTMEIELQYRDERERKLEEEVERLKRELATLKRRSRR